MADYVTDASENDGIMNACRHFGWIDWCLEYNRGMQAWFNGRTRPSQGCDAGSIPVACSMTCIQTSLKGDVFFLKSTYFMLLLIIEANWFKSMFFDLCEKIVRRFFQFFSQFNICSLKKVRIDLQCHWHIRMAKPSWYGNNIHTIIDKICRMRISDNPTQRILCSSP